MGVAGRANEVNGVGDIVTLLDMCNVPCISLWVG